MQRAVLLCERVKHRQAHISGRLVSDVVWLDLLGSKSIILAFPLSFGSVCLFESSE